MYSDNGHGVVSVTQQSIESLSSLREKASAASESGPADLWRTPWFARGTWGTLLCALYPLLVLTPLIVFAVALPPSDDAPIAKAAVSCAVVAFSILCLQFLLTARIRWIEAPFGLDVILRFHQGMALVAVCLLCVHPLLLASVQGWGLLTRWGVRWPIWAGRIALLLLLTHGVIAAGRRVLRLRYETWLFAHNVAAFLLLGFAFVHSLALGDDLARAGPRIAWIALPLVAWSAWFYRRVARPQMLARNPYKVLAVDREAPSVWTLTLEAPDRNRLIFAPGQFQFLRPLSGSVSGEEHPFSIASSPSPDGRISVTIKESGDFTSTIGKLAPGDLVAVHGPFGRFSHVFHRDCDDLVFIAAGVGITPLMSMLRYIRDRREACRVLLIYANREAPAIMFRQELEAIRLAGVPLLRVVHVVSRPSTDWQGLSGRLDAALVKAICRDLAGKTFFICCPPRMIASLVRGLKRAGIDPGRIHAECFGL